MFCCQKKEIEKESFCNISWVPRLEIKQDGHNESKQLIMEGHTMLSHGQQRRKKMYKSQRQNFNFFTLFSVVTMTPKTVAAWGTVQVFPMCLYILFYRRIISQLVLNVLMFAGLVKSIGVSNYTVDHLEELLQYSTVTPAVLQVLSPSHLNISMHLLCAVFHTFPSVVIRRKCSTNQELLS